MDKQPSKTHVTDDLPPQLERKFADLRRELRKRIFTEWALLAVLTLIAGFLLFMLWDRQVPVIMVGRLGLFLIGLAGLVVIGPILYYRLVYRNRQNAELTLMIKHHMPRFGDRLQGALELSSQDAELSHFSRDLSRAALERIAEESVDKDFYQALPVDRRSHLVWGVGGLVVLGLGAALWQPKESHNALTRYLLPFSDVARYTVIRFDNVPKQLYVPIGEAYQLEVALMESELLTNVPLGAMRMSGEPTQTSPYNMGYAFEIPPLEKRQKVTLQAGDAFASIFVIPTPRPRVQEVQVEQQLPDYLGLPTRRLQAESQVLSVLEGSRLKLELISNSLLARAQSDLDYQIEGNQASSAEFVVDSKNVIEVALTDTYGLHSKSPYKLTVKPIRDKAPKATIQAPEKEVILLPHETLDLHLTGKDDFGVRDLELLWHPLDEVTRIKTEPVAPGGNDLTYLQSEFAFNPEVLGVYPSSYAVYATAADAMPDRERSYSRPVTVHLLSLEEHAEHLHQRLSSLLDSLDETYSTERGLYQENQRIHESPLQNLRVESEHTRLQHSITGEKGQIKRLGKLHQETLKLLQDCFRNEQLHRSTQLSLAELAKQVQAIAHNDLPEVRNTLETVVDNRFSQDYAHKQLTTALTLQKSALKRMHEAIEQARAADRRFESSTFIHRLQEIAQRQQRLTSTLWQEAEAFLGDTPRTLDPALRHTNESTGQQQHKQSQTLMWIEQDLRNYAIRSDQAKFSVLADKIAGGAVYDGMQLISARLKDNHRYLATRESKQWATWLAQLVAEFSSEVSQSSSQGSGGGPGGGGGAKEQDTEFMLRVMEIIRNQQDLRGRTRALQQRQPREEESSDE